MKYIMTIAAVALLGGLFFQQKQPEEAKPQNEVKLIEVGKKAPDFNLETLDGGKIMLSRLKGRPVLLDFWATWCGPCRKALPHTQEIDQNYGDRMHVITVNLREENEKVQKFLEENKFEFHVVMDREGKTSHSYGVSGIPTFILIDKEGVVRLALVGFGPDTAKKLDAAIEKLLPPKTNDDEDGPPPDTDPDK
jgi:thiol-disulfide isomerase/thioredoxin